MADIDMIPRSYRNALRARRLLLLYGAALALLVAAGGAGAGVLRWRLGLETPRLADLRRDATRADALRAQATTTGQRRDTLAANAHAFSALHGTGTPAELARTLDAALNDKLWLDRVSLKRHHELVGPSSSAASAGIQEVATAGANGPQKWRLANQVEISGHALDQEALAAFMAALTSNPRVADVRFVDISAKAEDDSSLAFHIAATLRAPGGQK